MGKFYSEKRCESRGNSFGVLKALEITGRDIMQRRNQTFGAGGAKLL